MTGADGIGEGGSPTATIYAEDAGMQAALYRASERGGETVVPVTTNPGMVPFAQFRDLEGNVVGLASSEMLTE